LAVQKLGIEGEVDFSRLDRLVLAGRQVRRFAISSACFLPESIAS
jgi:hypothetical protein